MQAQLGCRSEAANRHQEPVSAVSASYSPDPCLNTSSRVQVFRCCWKISSGSVRTCAASWLSSCLPRAQSGTGLTGPSSSVSSSLSLHKQPDT